MIGVIHDRGNAAPRRDSETKRTHDLLVRAVLIGVDAVLNCISSRELSESCRPKADIFMRTLPLGTNGWLGHSVFGPGYPDRLTHFDRPGGCVDANGVSRHGITREALGRLG